MGRPPRLLNASCKPKEKKRIETFVLFNFNYCTPVVHFCNVGKVKSWDIVERALRYLCLDFESSYQNLSLKAGKSALHQLLLLID